MSLDDNKKVVKRYLEEVVGTGDVSSIGDFIAPGYVEVWEGVRHEIGLEGAIAHVEGVRKTYSDLSITVGRQIAEGEWVATCITARGTHTGAWAGIAPTGRELSFTGVNVNRVVNGRIVEHTGAANMLGPLMEAGAVAPARHKE